MLTYDYIIDSNISIFVITHFRSCLFCMIIVATDMSAVVRYFTRFTEEAFAALIGIIFVYEALKKLFSEFYIIKTELLI